MNAASVSLVPSPSSVDAATYFSPEQMDLIRRQIAPKATDDELKLFLYQAARTGLDPLSRQIYAIHRDEYDFDTRTKKPKMTIQTSIDGFRLIAERTERYAPGRENTFEYDEQGRVNKATAYVMKQTKDGRWHEVAASAYFLEYAQYKADKTLTRMWQEKPHIMLSKCAEALALRKAFPAEMSGLYTSDEMGKADEPEYTPPPSQEAAKAKPRKPVKAAEAPKTVADSGDIVTPLELSNLMLGSKPKGLGWAKPHAISWLKKRFGVEAPGDLNSRQAGDAKLLLLARLDSEEKYNTRLEMLASEGRVLGDGEVRE